MILCGELKKLFSKAIYGFHRNWIGGQAMEYYDIRKSGKDIDFVITDQDYQRLAEKYPEKRKDLYGDLGVDD